MKKIIVLVNLFILLATSSYSQNNPVDVREEAINKRIVTFGDKPDLSSPLNAYLTF